ncbi:MAG TPA: two-component regulator propeller domain-containing protein [Kofleriaceae bacterium]|nr:two-component regulator propeller domain-containing protein [Kofleriaceae bacterium]
MSARVVSFAIAILFGFQGTSLALDGHRRITQYAQTHFAAHDGMPHSLANAIAQTSDGYLWTTSQEGLSRFDGASFTTYDHGTTEGIPINQFTALAVDRKGTLWAGTRSRGVLHLVNGEFRPVAWEPGPQEQQTRVLAFDAGGDLWIGMRERGVVRLHDGALVAALGGRDGLPSDDVRSLLAAGDGAMWIGTFHGLVRWADGKLVRGPPPLDGVAVYSIAEDASGGLWCATDKGLLRLRGDAVEPVTAEGLAPGEATKLLFDRDGNLWIGTRTGVARMTADGRIERLPYPDALVNALFEDADGNLWIGSDRGLDRLRDGDVLPFGASEGLADEVVGAFREDATGAKWITTTGGLYRIAPGEMTATRLVAHRGLYAIYADAHGDMWFGGRDGNLGCWRNGKLTWLGSQDWERIHSLAETADGMWLGTDHGLFRMRGERLADAIAVVPGVAVRSIVRDSDGSLWLATDGGLMHWRGDAAADVPAGGPPRTTPVTTIVLDPDRTMWVGTEGAGLWRLRDGRWFAFTARHAMFDDSMWRILDDGLGNLWMSSNRGISRVSRQALDEVAAGKRAKVNAQAYGEADGMRDRECNGVADPAGWRTGDGRLWFPTGKGLVVIDPAHLRRREPPRALIESVRINGRPAPLAATLTLPAGGLRFELGYTAPTLRGPERLKFRYRLDGFESQWNEAGAQRVAQYTNLPPGDYRFIVAAAIDDKWGPEGVLAMTKPPLFYQTRWFDVLALAALVLVIAAVPLVRVRQLRRRARELDKRVQEAIGELKVLSGLLPICAWCKKIRDDGGYWSKIEAYLGERTDAKFTHGICPDCKTKMLAEESFG